MLNNKPVLAILSLITAVLLWAYVMGEVDPETTAKVSNIPVQIQNTEALAARDLAVKQDVPEYTASAIIKGKRSAVIQAKSSKLVANVDVSKAKLGDNELNVFFETPSGVTIDTGATDNHITIAVEQLESKELPVEVRFTSEKQGDFVPWATECSPEMITVSGAASTVRDVSKLVAVLDGNVPAAGATLTLDVQAVDGQSKPLHGVMMSADTVNATVKLLHMVRIPVEIGFTGLSGNYEVYKYNGVEETKVLVDEEIVNSVDKLVGTVELGQVANAGVFTRTVNIAVPEGVYIYPNQNDKVVVTIKEKVEQGEE